MTINDKQLQEWEELAEKATAGPWGWDIDGYAFERNILRGPQNEYIARFNKLSEWMGNRAFVVSSRTAVPELCAEVRRLQADNKQMQILLENYRNDHDWHSKLQADNARMREALENMLELSEHADFTNGVTSQDGRDEGDTIAGHYLDKARAALATSSQPAPGDTPAQQAQKD